MKLFDALVLAEKKYGCTRHSRVSLAEKIARCPGIRSPDRLNRKKYPNG